LSDAHATKFGYSRSAEPRKQTKMFQHIPLILAILIILGLIAVISRYFALWFRGFVCGTRIGLPSLVFMSLRRVNPRIIVDAKIMAVQAGLSSTSANEFEAHYLAGGDVKRVVLAMIAAHRARIELDWNTAAAIDLAGRDILEAVRVSVNPIVIDCPEPKNGERGTLAAVSKDGIQLRVRVCVTVRTNLSQLIGGATETTVIARVGEGIVSAIGSCDNYKIALANPMLIAKEVLEKSVDSQTAFAIVSIDVADIDVGKNIGALLQMDQAEADLRIAQAHAEERRAKAIAVEREMVALTIENRSEVVLAEAEVPTAIADAFRAGNFGGKKGRIMLAKNCPSAFSRVQV
jgi:uncharacterized protein YqfA (UPF0365 family)